MLKRKGSSLLKLRVTMATSFINLNLVGVKVFSLTDYFRLGGYQNGHRYTRFRIQTKEQTLAMSKVGGMVAKKLSARKLWTDMNIFWAEIDLIKYS